MSKLALLGGRPVRIKPFPGYNTIGKEEKQAVMKVLDTGLLSDFVGAYGDKFFGGVQVQTLEREWCEYFNVKHAIAVNSATSGLFAALGAIGIGPGDEVIVPAATMSASIIGVLVYNAIPVFADIEEELLCIDLESVRQRITSRTKAILAVNLAGQPAALDELMTIARKYNLRLIEDNAQAPGALCNGRYAGTIGDMGVFSLNCHKTIQCGEGGMVVTNNPELAEKVRLIRNHAEAVISGMPVLPADISNMLGWNYRMTEIEAAISQEQLKKLSGLNQERIERVKYLNRKLDKIKGISSPKVRDGCTHVYYVQVLHFDEKCYEVDNRTFVKAIQAEGIPPNMLWGGWVFPLYLQPLYQKQIAYGEKGCPFSCAYYGNKVDYRKGICPTAEKLYEHDLIVNRLIYPPLSQNDLNDIVRIFEKVAENIKDLRKQGKSDSGN